MTTLLLECSFAPDRLQVYATAISMHMRVVLCDRNRIKQKRTIIGITNTTTVYGVLYVAYAGIPALTNRGSRQVFALIDRGSICSVRPHQAATSYAIRPKLLRHKSKQSSDSFLWLLLYSDAGLIARHHLPVSTGQRISVASTERLYCATLLSTGQLHDTRQCTNDISQGL